MTLEGSRQCYICLDTSSAGDMDWVHPCRCTGTMAWVHKGCVLRWVKIHKVYFCPQCLTPYLITPTKGPLFKAMEYIERTLHPNFNSVVAFLMGCAGVDLGFTALGMLAFILVYGVEETFQILLTTNNAEILAKLHLVSYALLAINSVSWEDHLLKTLQYVAKIPVCSLFLPTYTSRRALVLFNKPSVYKSIAGSVMLPVFGRICGEVFFKNVHNQLNRVILGGMFYLAVKGGVYMYYAQKLMVRLDQIQVLPYVSQQGSSLQNSLDETTLSDSQEGSVTQSSQDSLNSEDFEQGTVPVG